ncbi:hypothetical protein CROQUDRAFT_658373 [Cronartium quercuum f. sp. fusiforme G11]|uniref:FHA domain-containing protein n=1 Tax=Cronartium quercuum f. sp. fusiforme G11 TaxID=708437 RepID=A0A9P6NGQ9_9BASI|nr:hypothetical protein CROQUDRAFT_658373 [Cronartium quercuum f. sp. fusiforme G11]
MPDNGERDASHSRRRIDDREPASSSKRPDRDHRGSDREYRGSDRDDRRARRSFSPDRRRTTRPEDRERDRSPRLRESRLEDRENRSRRELERHRPEPSPPRQSRSRPRSRSPTAQSLVIPEAREISEDAERDLSELPNFAPSGKLAAETKTVNGVVLKYHEPAEARKPSTHWRLYVFKGEEQLDVLHVHRQSAYLFGRDRLVVDVPIDHPSSSKQHAVLQFRQVQSKNEFGDIKSSVKPFLIDLESANATFVNGQKIPEARYYELQSGDVIKFGLSTREFVLIPET